jgi:hypothetical protein
MRIPISRTLALLVASAVGLASLASWAEPPASPVIAIFRSSACGCCSKWAEHLQENGFTVEEIETHDLVSVKRRYGVPPQFSTCHTGVVGGYVIEGHVPAPDIQRLLRERPPAAGLVVPGMPMGSPGMEGEVSQAYDVLLFDAAGRTKVYAHH